jgi:hypothetical protein
MTKKGVFCFLYKELIFNQVNEYIHNSTNFVVLLSSSAICIPDDDRQWSQEMTDDDNGIKR